MSGEILTSLLPELIGKIAKLLNPCSLLTFYYTSKALRYLLQIQKIREPSLDIYTLQIFTGSESFATWLIRFGWKRSRWHDLEQPLSVYPEITIDPSDLALCPKFFVFEILMGFRAPMQLIKRFVARVFAQSEEEDKNPIITLGSLIFAMLLAGRLEEQKQICTLFNLDEKFKSEECYAWQDFSSEVPVTVLLVINFLRACYQEDFTAPCAIDVLHEKFEVECGILDFYFKLAHTIHPKARNGFYKWCRARSHTNKVLLRYNDKYLLNNFNDDLFSTLSMTISDLEKWQVLTTTNTSFRTLLVRRSIRSVELLHKAGATDLGNLLDQSNPFEGDPTFLDKLIYGIHREKRVEGDSLFPPASLIFLNSLKNPVYTSSLRVLQYLESYGLSVRENLTYSVPKCEGQEVTLTLTDDEFPPETPPALRQIISAGITLRAPATLDFSPAAECGTLEWLQILAHYNLRIKEHDSILFLWFSSLVPKMIETIDFSYLGIHLYYGRNIFSKPFGPIWYEWVKKRVPVPRLDDSALIVAQPPTILYSPSRRIARWTGLCDCIYYLEAKEVVTYLTILKERKGDYVPYHLKIDTHDAGGRDTGAADIVVKLMNECMSLRAEK